MKLWEALKAFDEGKQIEFRLTTSLGVDGWSQVEKDHVFVFVSGTTHYEFRLKPNAPEVVEFVLDCKGRSPAQAMDYPETGPTYAQYTKMKGKRWRIVATEIVEGEG